MRNKKIFSSKEIATIKRLRNRHNWTWEKISKKINCDCETLRNYMRNIGLDTSNKNKSPSSYKIWKQTEVKKVLELAESGEKNIVIGLMFDKSEKAISELLRRHKKQRKSRSKLKLTPEQDDLIIQLRTEQNMQWHLIAPIVKVGISTIIKRAKVLGIYVKKNLGDYSKMQRETLEVRSQQ